MKYHRAYLQPAVIAAVWEKLEPLGWARNANPIQFVDPRQHIGGRHVQAHTACRRAGIDYRSLVSALPDVPVSEKKRIRDEYAAARRAKKEAMTTGYTLSISIVPVTAGVRLTRAQFIAACHEASPQIAAHVNTGAGVIGGLHYTWRYIGPEGGPPDPGVLP